MVPPLIVSVPSFRIPPPPLELNPPLITPPPVPLMVSVPWFLITQPSFTALPRLRFSVCPLRSSVTFLPASTVRCPSVETAL